MATTFEAWLRELRAAGKGPATLRGCSRGRAWSTVLGIGADVSDWAFIGAAKLAPDAIETEAEFTIAVGAYAAGVTPVTLSLSAADTSALPADSDGDGIEAFAFDLLATPPGEDEFLLMGGTLPLLGSVTA